MTKQRVSRESRAVRRPTRRDRHGRGLRGSLVPTDVPLARTRSEVFDDLVLDAVEHLDERWGAQLADVEFAVEDVPPSPQRHVGDRPVVPLARVLPPSGRRSARIVLYRRPLEARASDRDELGDIVHDIVVEHVAELLGLEPETVDPGYAGNNWDDE